MTVLHYSRPEESEESEENEEIREYPGALRYYNPKLLQTFSNVIDEAIRKLPPLLLG